MRLLSALLTTCLTATVVGLSPLPAHAAYGPSGDCVRQGGTVAQSGWLYPVLDGLYTDVSYKQVDQDTLWLCLRAHYIAQQAGVKITVSTASLPQVDGDTDHCRLGMVLAAGEVGPDRMPYELAYRVTSTSASLCIRAVGFNMRLFVALPSGVPALPVLVEPEAGTWGGPGEEVPQAPAGSASGTCTGGQWAHLAMTVAGYPLLVHNGGDDVCIRLGVAGGRLDIHQKGAVPGVGFSIARRDFTRCDVHVFSSAVPVRTQITYQSAPGPDGDQWVCIDNDEQPLVLMLRPATPDPMNPPSVEFTPDE